MAELEVLFCEATTFDRIITFFNYYYNINVSNF